MEKLLLTVCIFIFVFSGCTKGDKEYKAEAVKDKKEFKVEEPPYDTTVPGKEGVENTIRAYNWVLINAHLADPYFNVLRKYATDKETQRVFIESRHDNERGLAMRNRLKKMVFGNISVAENNGYADTLEAWDFEYIDIKTKEVKEPLRTVNYTLRYFLEKEENRWIVSRIKERQPRVFKSPVQ